MAVEPVYPLGAWGHDHPLMLIKKEETEDSWDLSCYGCEQPILAVSFYGCKQCGYYLHESCRDLPRELTHPYHPQHPLVLHRHPPSANLRCDVCDESCNRFIYRCSRSCDFDIGMKCASVALRIKQSIKHPSHTAHQLVPLQKESMFLCDACGIQHKGTSFLCTTCGFWINQKCAESPLNLKLNNRDRHALSLIYNYPQEDFFRPQPNCQICSKEVYRNWVYCCSECCLLVHLHCAESEKEHSTNYETETESHDSINLCSGNRTMTYLPVHDDSANLIEQFIQKIRNQILSLPDESDNPIEEYIKDIRNRNPIISEHNDQCRAIAEFIKNLRNDIQYKVAAEVTHFSHPDHRLTLFEKPIDHGTSCSMSNLSSLLNGATNDTKCSGCAQSISAPFYHCVQCNIFLHGWCADLPTGMGHPGHPEHKLLIYSIKTHMVCSCCNLLGNVLFYACRECNFQLDVKCASLPRVIKDEAHKHNLSLRPTSASTCISCSIHSDLMYLCDTCKCHLCVRCALLPRTVRHKSYDKHPLTLTYSPLPYQTDEDFCDICEEEIDSRRWFYHCGECNLYLHTDCILPVHQYSNMVYGHTVNTRKHQHRLTSVQPNEDSWCSLCKSKKHCHHMAYSCSPCKFLMCVHCWTHEGK